MTAPNDVTAQTQGNSPRPGKRRRQRGIPEENDSPFNQARSPDHQMALRAYWVALWGLIPLLGVVCGPAATLLGLYLRWKQRGNPEFKGRHLATAAVVLGTLLWLTTWVGVALMAQGLSGE